MLTVKMFFRSSAVFELEFSRGCFWKIAKVDFCMCPRSGVDIIRKLCVVAML